MLPPYGLCLPCRFVRARDGDTIEVSLLGGLVWAIRLIDCWCLEPLRGTSAERALGVTAKEYAARCCDEAQQLSVWIPAPERMAEHLKTLELESELRPVNLLRWLTFDRLPGHIYVSSEERLSDLMVRAGFAARTKCGQAALIPDT